MVSVNLKKETKMICKICGREMCEHSSFEKGQILEEMKGFTEKEKESIHSIREAIIRDQNRESPPGWNQIIPWTFK